MLIKKFLLFSFIGIIIFLIPYFLFRSMLRYSEPNVTNLYFNELKNNNSFTLIKIPYFLSDSYYLPCNAISINENTNYGREKLNIYEVKCE